MSETKAPASSKPSTTPATPSVGQNGKGDAPRNISSKFRKNYDAIRWKSGKLPAGKKFVKVY